MSVTATARMGTENANRMSRAKNAEMNPPFVFMGNMNRQYQPEFYVRIFNVSDYEQRIERPWVSWNPAQRARMIVIPAKRKGEKYSTPFTISDIVQMPVENIGRDEFNTRGVDGKFLAQDALNPEDPTGSWKTVRPVNSGVAANEGTNLYWEGLFWTINDVPSDEEVSAAVTRMEQRYNDRIEEAKALWGGGEEMRKQIGTSHRRAASYFDLEFPWNQIYRAKKECPGCGEKIAVNAVVCSKCPATFDWQQALSLGLRTAKQAQDAGLMIGQAQSFAEKPSRKARAKA